MVIINVKAEVHLNNLFLTSNLSNGSSQTADTGDVDRIVHTIRAGETLYAIAAKYGVTANDIKHWNNFDKLITGKNLVIYPNTPSTRIEAHDTPIDVFMKNYPSKEGITSVTMSQQMLQTIFASSYESKSTTTRSTPEETVEVTVVETGVQRKVSTVSRTSDGGTVTVSSPPTTVSQDVRIIGLNNLNVPEAYSSVTVSSTSYNPEVLIANLKKTLPGYETYMEINKEKLIELGYYVKKLNDNMNEIMVIRQQKGQFSAIYIKGNIKIEQVDIYLSKIKNALSRMGAADKTDMFYWHHVAFLLFAKSNHALPPFS